MNFVFDHSDSLACVVCTQRTKHLVSTAAMPNILAKGVKHCFYENKCSPFDATKK